MRPTARPHFDGADRPSHVASPLPAADYPPHRAPREDVCLDDRPDEHDAAFRLALAHPARPADGLDDPGDALRCAREEQGISLEEMSRLTKISVAKLTALEHNDIDELPSDVYVRGFLRAYAREVELDPEETVQRYFARLDAEQELVSVTAPPVPRIDRKRDSAAAAIAHDTGVPVAPRPLMAELTRPRVAVALLAVLAVLAYATFTGSNASAPAVTSAAVIPSADVARASADPAADPVAAATPAVLEFELQPQGPCWISANADGERVMSRLLQPGERHTFQVRDELLLRVGDPGAVTFSINGEAGRALGRAGEPVNVRITRDNYREFLTSQS
jgi:cytoskeletal protein RodZ